MKRKERLLWSNRLLSLCLALLGFASCGTGNLREEYGTPVADFQVKGKVIDAQTKLPIKGIRIVAGTLQRGSGDAWVMYNPDTLTTNEEGSYDHLITDFPSARFRVVWEDMDGDANGAYLDGSKDMPVGQFVGGTGWYKGTATIEATIEAERKEP